MKRTFDILLSLTSLLVLLPLFVVVAVLIKLNMPGPVFFRQVRIGRHGKPFRIVKFRSMVVNRDATSITLDGDRRITPLGRFLRRSKIDELPQLWNILIGHMSFVGPRPDVPGYADQLSGEDRIILSVRPGLTGPDSVAYPEEESLLARQADPDTYYDQVLYPEKVRINREYLQQRTFWSDLGIIWRTFLWLFFKK
jgi:lipopolysaccharide/colanic/teichoic acid biosynthesis glycosyltransferase